MSSTKQQDEPPRRKWTARVRTGCMTCRTRRIKCDEAKPACLRCTVSRKECVGVGYGASSPAPTTPVAASPMAPTLMELNLSGYFQTWISVKDEFNAEFWNYYVPQLRHTLPPVWRAGNAVAGSKWSRNPEANLDPAVRGNLDKEGLKQYSAAVTLLLAITHDLNCTAQDKTAVLLANVLLYMYAIEVEDVLSIAAHSCMLIQYWRYWECAESGPLSAPALHLLHYFVKLQRLPMECQFRYPAPPTHSWLDAVVCLQQRPLQSPLQAFVELEMIWNSVRALMERIPIRPTRKDLQAAAAERHAFHPQLVLWNSRYAELRPSLQAKDRVRRAVLDARRILLGILFRVDFDRSEGLWDETCWDDFEAEFIRARDIVIDILDAEDSDFSEMQYMPTLYKALGFIVKSCRTLPQRRYAAATVRTQVEESMGRLPLTRSGLTLDLKPTFPYTLLEGIVDVEEGAWEAGSDSSCDEAKGCVRGEFICNMHRVIGTSRRLRVPGPSVCFFTTVSDALQGRPGKALDAYVWMAG